jgi:translocation and assembly module TamB
MAPGGPKSRARRALGVIGVAVGTTVTFVAASVAGAVLHLDAPATRRLVAAQANELLREQFAGDVAVEHIGGLGLRGVEGVRGRVKDPTGAQVLFVDGARVRLHTVDAARSALLGKGDVRVPVDVASIDHVDAAIDKGPDGKLRIASAFAPRTVTPPKPRDPNARGVRIDAPTVGLAHAWVHGQGAGPALDAELRGLVAHAHYDPRLTKADLDRVDLVARGLPRGVDLRGRVDGHFSEPSDSGKDRDVEGAFTGVVAGASTNAHARMDGQRIDAVVDGHDPASRAMRSTFGEVAMREELTVHAEAHGELPRVDATVHIGLGRATVDAVGHVDSSDGTKVRASVAMRHVDLHGIVAKAPASDVSLDTRGDVVIAKSGELSAHVSGRILDPRATADFDVDLTSASEAKIVEARLHADVADFSRLPMVGSGLKGHASLEASGTVDLSTKALEARARVASGGIARGAQKLDELTLLATAQGTLEHPLVEVGAHVSGLASGAQRIDVADVRARIEPGKVTTILDAHVDVVRDNRTASVTASRAEIGGPRLVVEGAVIEGFGEPIFADLSRDAQELHVKLAAPAIDLARVARLAGRPSAASGGYLAIRGDVALRREGVAGALHASVDSFSNGKIHGARGDLDVCMTGNALDVAMKAELGDAGEIELAMRQIVIGGSPVDSASWKRAQGRGKLDANLDLTKLATLVPEGVLPVGELGGRLVVQGTVRRAGADAPPDLSVHAHTHGLVIRGKPAPAPKPAPSPSHAAAHGEIVRGVAPWQTNGVDASLDARLDAMSGLGEVALRVLDENGTILGVDAKAGLPYKELLGDPSKAVALLEKAPVGARLVVPKRALSAMPELLGTHGMPGTVEVEVDLSGTALEPKVSLVAHARGIRDVATTSSASDADLTFGYEGEKAELAATVTTDQHRALDLSARIDVRARDLLVPTAGRPLAWAGSARAKVASFPVEAVSAIADRQVRGRITGEVVIENLHKNATLTAHLGLEGMKIGSAAYKSGKVVVVAKDERLTASARLDQNDGFAELQVTTGLRWRDALVPTLERDAGAQVHLEAKSFQAAAIVPFVRQQVHALTGRIDANATVKVGPGLEHPTMQGKVAFHDGTLQVAAFGVEYKNARATITFQQDGQIKIDDVFLEGTDGQVTASGVVKTRGLALESALAKLHVPKEKPLELALQGQALGAVSGDVVVAATNSEDGKGLKLKVNVPKLNVVVPKKIHSGAQELAEPKYIRVGTFRGPKEFVTLPLDHQDLQAPSKAKKSSTASTTEVDIQLGEVTVVQGKGIRVVFTGAPHVKLGDKTEVSGQIVVKEGSIDVQGKTFRVERATVTFQPDAPSNPVVVATAEWVADDGTRVFAEFRGPLETGKLNLRSDPPRPRNEVLAMILFGTADGATPPPGGAQQQQQQSSGAAAGAAAAGIAGSVAAQGLTDAVDDLTGIQATAKVDTSRAANPAPEVQVQIARHLSIAFAHVLGTPPISQPDTNIATVEWRFRANWSLATMFGDRGLIQSDVIWQKRY